MPKVTKPVESYYKRKKREAEEAKQAANILAKKSAKELKKKLKAITVKNPPIDNSDLSPKELKKIKNRQHREAKKQNRKRIAELEIFSKTYHNLGTQQTTTFVNLLTQKGCMEMTNETCWHPDIYLNDDRHCNNCRIYKYCQCRIKKIWNGKLH